MTRDPLWQDGQVEARSPSERLRTDLASNETLLMPGVFNALSARVVEQLGFKCMLLGGSAVSNSYLGLPDAEFLTLDQLVMIVGYITSAVEVPLIVDVDTGYGNALGGAHTTHLLQKAGASGLIIEDQLSPKRSGHIAGKQVIPVDEMVGKIQAVVDARYDSDFLIVARCDARATEGVDGAIERANAYAAAGAEMTLVDGALSHEELQRFATEIDSRFHLANSGGSAKTRTTPKLSIPEYQQMGYNSVAFGLQMLRSAALGMFRFATGLHSSGIDEDLRLLALLEGEPYEDWYTWTGFDRIAARELRYLPKKDVEQRYANQPPEYHLPTPPSE